VTTSTIRFVLIAALVVGGIFVMNQAFPDGATADGGTVAPVPDEGGAGPTGETGATPPTGPTGETAGGPADVPEPQIDGVVIAVFNTTDVPGLAQELQDELVAEGYEAPGEPGNADFSQNSRIFFRTPGDEADAEYIANEYFGRYDITPAKLQPGSDLDREVQVAIYIGNDYAADQPAG
jgi:hypothetical protein